MKKKLIIILTVLLVCVAVTVLFLPQISSPQVGIHFTVGFHTTITMTNHGVKVFDEYHAGVITKLGMNMTMAHITGNDVLYNDTQITCFLEWISIGNQGTLNTDSTCLPGEWNRTGLTAHDGTYNSCNFTAVFYPDTGPYTADCLGINFETGIGNNALWGYDTFTEVTGITNTFVITFEVKITIS